MPTYPNDLSVLFVWEIASKLFTQEMVSINLLFNCSIIKHWIMCTKGTRGRGSIDTSDRHSTEISKLMLEYLFFDFAPFGGSEIVSSLDQFL